MLMTGSDEFGTIGGYQKTNDTPPKFNIAPEKLPKPNRKGSSSNQHQEQTRC